MGKLIFKIARKLPKSILKPLVWIYQKWSSKIILDKNMVKDLGGYSNLEQKEVIWLLKSGKRLNAAFWRMLNPKTEKEMEEFYKITPFYIFELPLWHMTRVQLKFRSKIIELAQGEILDYGGGIGDLSIKIHQKGLNIDYADVAGRTFDFAKWLFQRRGCRIKMIDLSQDKLSKKYDTIICLDVIEHIPNPKAVLENLANHLKNNGKLIITGLDNREVSPKTHPLKAHPMHLAMKFNPGEYLNSLGLSGTEYSWLWIKTQRI